MPWWPNRRREWQDSFARRYDVVGVYCAKRAPGLSAYFTLVIMATSEQPMKPGIPPPSEVEWRCVVLRSFLLHVNTGTRRYEMRRECQEIIPGLFLGPFQVSKSLDLLKQLGITHMYTRSPLSMSVTDSWVLYLVCVSGTRRKRSLWNHGFQNISDIWC